ncbi:MAG: hypothetical protein ACOCX2_02185 [Armatimonadota bacterium]
MKRKATHLMAIAFITIALAGCGGGVTALLGLIGIGSAVGDITDLFSGSDEEQAEVLLGVQPPDEDHARASRGAAPAADRRQRLPRDPASHQCGRGF